MTRRRIEVTYPMYKVIGNGCLSSTEIGEGRFLPSLIIDTEGDVEVSELIALHKTAPPGDTDLSWGIPATFFKSDTITLILEFIRPMKVNFGIDFSVKENHSIIDGIIQSRGFYLQVGSVGDKISEFKNDFILIEVPDLSFDEYWEKILFDLVKDNLKKNGVKRKEVNNLTAEHIKKMREVWNVRRNN